MSLAAVVRRMHNDDMEAGGAGQRALMQDWADHCAAVAPK